MVDFEPRKDDGGMVFVKNVRQLRLTGKKLNQKIYYHHTGYPGGIKEVTMKKLFAIKPSEVLRKAVYGMLPNNKLRDRQITRLKFVPARIATPARQPNLPEVTTSLQAGGSLGGGRSVAGGKPEA